MPMVTTMTTEQMIDRAKRAEQLCDRYSKLEVEHEKTGLYEDALELERLRLEQQHAAEYWRLRAGGAAV